MLLATSEGDPFDGAANVRTWASGLSHVATAIVPGSDHGMAIYYTVQKKVVAYAGKVTSVRAATPGKAKNRKHK